jgi:cytochrome c5
MCHSPSYHIFSDKLSLGAPIRKYTLTGAKIAGYLAPDITKKNLSTVPLEEIINVFTKDTLIGGGKVEGPMLEVNHDSLRYLDRADLEAIALYLKSLQSAAPPKPSGSVGKVIYESYCVGCHASGGGGAPKYGDGSSWDPVLQKGIEKVYHNAIQGVGGMPAKGTCISCSADDIKQAVNYMVAAVTGPGGKIIRVEKPKKLTAEDGKRMYDKNCSICHASGFKGAPKPGDKKTWTPILANGFVETYLNVETGRKGHPPRGACMECSDDDLIAAVKYMMQQSATDRNYNLW